MHQERACRATRAPGGCVALAGKISTQSTITPITFLCRIMQLPHWSVKEGLGGPLADKGKELSPHPAHYKSSPQETWGVRPFCLKDLWGRCHGDVTVTRPVRRDTLAPLRAQRSTGPGDCQAATAPRARRVPAGSPSAVEAEGFCGRREPPLCPPRSHKAASRRGRLRSALPARRRQGSAAAGSSSALHPSPSRPPLARAHLPFRKRSRFPALYTLLKIACRRARQSGGAEFRIGPMAGAVTARLGHARRSRDACRAAIGRLWHHWHAGRGVRGGDWAAAAGGVMGSRGAGEGAGGGGGGAAGQSFE